MDPSVHQAPLPPPPTHQNPPGGGGAQFMAATTSDFPKFGGLSGNHHHPLNIYSRGKAPPPDMTLPDLPGGGSGTALVQSILLPSTQLPEAAPPPPPPEAGRPPMRGMPGLNSGPHSTDNLFGLNISQFGGLSVSQVEGLETSALSGKLPSGIGAAPGGGRSSNHPPDNFPLHPSLPAMDGGLGSGGHNPLGGMALGGGSGLSGGTIVTPSTSYIVMAPGVFSGADQQQQQHPSTFSSTHHRGGGGAGGVVPIGSERAQKATLAAFPISTGGVWSYSGGKSSEGTDWSKLSSQSSDWPSTVPNTFTSLAPGSNKKEAGHMTGSDVMLTPQDTLESFLTKVSLSEYLSTFKENEIDLNALKLMGATDFSEIGIPSGLQQRLLSAMRSTSRVPDALSKGPSPVTSSAPLDLSAAPPPSLARPSSRQH